MFARPAFICRCCDPHKHINSAQFVQYKLLWFFRTCMPIAPLIFHVGFNFLWEVIIEPALAVYWMCLLNQIWWLLSSVGTCCDDLIFVRLHQHYNPSMYQLGGINCSMVVNPGMFLSSNKIYPTSHQLLMSLQRLINYPHVINCPLYKLP